MQARPKPSLRLTPVTLGWACIALFTALLAAYLATHRSEDPEWFGRYSQPYLLILILMTGAAVGAATVCLPRFGARWQEPMRNTLLFLVSMLITLAATEVLVRATDPLGISYYEASADYQGDKLADPDLGVRHRPSYSASYGGVASDFNELGMRDRSMATRPDDELRILALGDSVTFGWGAAQSETFSEQLEVLLGQALRRPVSVLNTGVGGYNTVQELGVLRKLGPVLQPDLLLLTYTTNDHETFSGPVNPQSRATLEGKSPPEVIQLLLGRLWLYRLVYHVALYGNLGFSPSVTDDSATRNAGWRDSMASLGEIARAATDAGVPLVVIFYRMSVQEAPQLLADVTAAVAPVPVVDSAAWFAGRDVLALTNSRVDPHPNGQGHAVLAGGIAKYLLASGLIPPAAPDGLK